MEESNLEIKMYKLEVWKAIASFLTPIVLVILTFQVNTVLKEKEHQLKVGEQILKEKQAIYSDIGKKLNIIFVYVADVGDFRRYDPLDIIQKKREVDRIFKMYAPYWTDETESKYSDFMRSTFKTYNAPGVRAKIRATKYEKVKAYQVDKIQWNEDWNKYFTEERDPNYFSKYYDLVESLLADIVSTNVRKISEP